MVCFRDLVISVPGKINVFFMDPFSRSVSGSNSQGRFGLKRLESVMNRPCLDLRLFGTVVDGGIRGY